MKVCWKLKRYIRRRAFSYDKDNIMKLALLWRWVDRSSFLVALLVINAAIGTGVCFDPGLFQAGSGKFIFGLGAFVASVTLCFFRRNLLFQARMALLIVIGYYAGLVKVVDPSAAFSPMEIDAQTFNVGARMFGLTSIALLGAAGGLLAAGLRLSHPKRTWVGISTGGKSWHALFWISTAIVIFAGYLSARSYGPSVLEAAYASGEGEGQLLGNLQSVGVSCLVMAFVAGSHLRRTWITPFLVALSVYYLGWSIFLRGGRLEVLAGVLALVIAVPAAHGKVQRLRIPHYVGVLFLALFMEAWGSLRGTLSETNADMETGGTIVEGYRQLAEMGIYHAGTISGIATTFANTLHMIEHGVIGFRFGNTYFDYLLRSPPEFMYPGRPPDLAWMFEAYGYAAAGGFFELAEAYLNFGIFGCLLIPFCISFFIASCYRKALLGRFFWFILLISLLSVFFRGAWYQSFAYYKASLTGIVLYVGFCVVNGLVFQRRGASPIMEERRRYRELVEHEGRASHAVSSVQV